MKAVGNYRPRFYTHSPIVFGKKINISMPNGEKRTGQFLIVDLDDIIASHDERRFQSSIGYPHNPDGSNINDRNYMDDLNAQAMVIKYAKELDPERIITTSRTASGTPIITKDGFVVSGNNRTMSMKLVAKDFPENYKEYNVFLLEEAEAYGFSNPKVSQIISKDNIVDNRHRGETFRDNKYIKINKPILVRVDFDFPVYNTEELAKYNKDTKKAERPIDKAIKLSHILRSNKGCFDSIADIVGEYETFSEFYQRLQPQVKLIKVVLDCNIITEQELPAYFVGGVITEAGKDFIEQMLGSMVLGKDALIATNLAGVKQYRQTLITSLPVLIANANLHDGSLNKELNLAIMFLYDMASTSSTLFDVLNSQTMFEQKMFNYKAVVLSQLLMQGRNKFKKTLEKYNQGVKSEQSASLFGDKKNSNEIFELIIAAVVPEKDLKVINRSKLVLKGTGKKAEPEPITKGFPIEKQVEKLNKEVDRLWLKYNNTPDLSNYASKEDFQKQARYGMITIKQ